MRRSLQTLIAVVLLGATLAAATGATTKELMRRLGHSSPAAALVYQGLRSTSRAIVRVSAEEVR